MPYIPYTTEDGVTPETTGAPEVIEAPAQNKYVPYDAGVPADVDLSPQEETFLSAEPKRSVFRQAKDFLFTPQTPSAAKSANIMALADVKNLSPMDVMENYDEVTKDLRDQPTGMEALSTSGHMALLGALITNPLTTLGGLATFVGLDETKSFLVAKAQGEDRELGETKHVSELLPEQYQGRVADAMDVLEFAGLAAATHGVTSGVSKSAWWNKLTNKQRGLEVLNAARSAKVTGKTIGEEIRAGVKARGGIGTPEGSTYFKRMQDVHTRGRAAFSEVVAEDTVIQSEFTNVGKKTQKKAYSEIFNRLSKAEQDRVLAKHASKSGLDISIKRKAAGGKAVKVDKPAPVTNDLVVDTDLNVSQLKGMDELAQDLAADAVESKAKGQNLPELNPIEEFTADEVAQLTDLGLTFKVKQNVAEMSKKAKTPEEKKAVRIWNSFAQTHLLDKTVIPSAFELQLTKRSSKTVFEMFGDFNSFSESITDPKGNIIRSKVKGAKKESYDSLLSELKAVHKDAITRGMTIEEFLVDTNKATPNQAQIVASYMDQVLTPVPDTNELGVTKPGKITGDAKRVEKLFADTRKAKEIQRQTDIKKAIKGVQRELTDRAVEVRYALENAGDVKAQQALMRFNLIAGASPAADAYYKKAWPNIFGTLNGKEVGVLEELIHVKKEISVLGRKKGRAGLPAADYEAWLAQIKEMTGLDDARLNVVLESADVYFKTMQDLLKKKKDEGIVSAELYDILVQNQYSPTQWLKAEALYDQAMLGGGADSGRRPLASLDELEAFVNRMPVPKAGSAQVKSSGLFKLKSGEIDDFQNLDAQNALAMITNETYSRIFKNRATSALDDFAKNVVDENGSVIPAKISKWSVDEQGNFYPSYKNPPKGYRELHYFQDGQRKAVWTKAEFAEQWDTGGVDINNAMLSVIHHASGASVLKAMATGIGSPLFGLTKGLLMDVPYSYFTLQKTVDMTKVTSLYPINPYKFTQAILSNIREVASDVLYQKGEFLEMAKEGGLFGTIGQTTSSKAHKTGKFRRGFETLNEWGNFINSRSEYLVRMANRREFIKQGYEPWEATAMVRDSLPYEQGGRYVKIADRVLPYLNVSILTTRKAGKSVIKNPKEQSYKIAWFMGVAGSIAVYNQIFNQEAIQQESDFNKEGNYIIPSGYSFDDDLGNKRYVNFKLKKEPVLAPYMLAAEMLVARAFGNEVEFNKLGSALFKSGSPLSGLPNVPLQSALNTLGYKKNSWNFQDIWRGAPAGKEEWDQQRSSKLWYDLGQQLNFSPEVLKSSIEQIITHEALPQRIVENTYDYIFNNVEQRDQDGMMADFFLSNWKPGFMSVTSETTNLREGISEAEVEAQGKKEIGNRFIDSYGYKYFKSDTPEEQPETLEAINKELEKYKLDRPERDRLMQRFRDYGRTQAYPHQSTWLMFGGISDPKVRGKEVAKWRNTQSFDEQREVDVRMNRLAVTKSGIIPQDRGGTFWREFRLEVNRLNTEK